MELSGISAHFNQDDAVCEDLESLARNAAIALDGPLSSFMFRPAIEFENEIAQLVLETTGELRLCLAFLSLVIRDVLQNLAGDVPYEPLSDRLDLARASVQRALGATLRSLADDLCSKHSLESTIGHCSALAGVYAAAIAQLNENGGY